MARIQIISKNKQNIRSALLQCLSDPNRIRCCFCQFKYYRSEELTI